MLFTYRAIDQDGHERDGTVEALSKEAAIAALQRRSLVISALTSADAKKISLSTDITFFTRIKTKDIVILSRQIATLFEAQVAALRVFRLLAGEVENKKLAKVLSAVADDIQEGAPISRALGKHGNVFSAFYVNMVRAGEESGKLSETFVYLADYLDRSYEVASKVESALIYPAFVVVVFIVIMILMLIYVIPQISKVLIDSGQRLPLYTRIVIGISNFASHYAFFILIALVLLGIYTWRFAKTDAGKHFLDDAKIHTPYIGDLFTKLYLARIADNFATMLLSGVAVIEALNITSSVVGNEVYRRVLGSVAEDVKGGSSISDALARHGEIPGIMVAMVKVGEETGELGKILGTLATFYNREVKTAVDTLVGLIEPFMIVFLGAAVGVLLSAILLPIYNLANSIG